MKYLKTSEILSVSPDLQVSDYLMKNCQNDIFDVVQSAITDMPAVLLFIYGLRVDRQKSMPSFPIGM